MIRAEFYESDGLKSGFALNGHSGYAESGFDIVCAAVSSAVQLTVNLLLDFSFDAEVKAENNNLKCSVNNVDENADTIISALESHLKAILDEYPKTIKITTLEV